MLMDFSCHAFLIEFICSQSIWLIKSMLLILLMCILRFSRLKSFSNESKTYISPVFISYEPKCFLKIIKKHPWNESVKTILASINARSHFVDEGVINHLLFHHVLVYIYSFSSLPDNFSSINYFFQF